MANGVIDAVSRATGLGSPLGSVVEMGKRGFAVGVKVLTAALINVIPPLTNYNY